MTSIDPHTPHQTRLLAGCLLLAYALAGWLAPAIPVPMGLPFSLAGLPTQVATLCALPAATVILSSMVDRADGRHAVGAYCLIGRWFWWAGLLLAALSVALAATRTSFADDLRNPGRLVAVALVALTAFALLAYLSRHPRPERPTPPAPTPPSSRGKALLALLLTAIAAFMLYQRYKEKLARDATYERQDAAERLAAPPWQHDLNAFRGGLSMDDVRARLRSSGHSLRCFTDLRSENRLRQDDRANCWVMVGDVWGVAAHGAVFWFGDEGLRHHMLRFPETSWPQVENRLDAMGQRLDFPLGKDADSGRPVIGWRMDSGLAMSATPAPGTDISVLWTAKDEVAREHCPYRKEPARNPAGYSIPVGRLWPELDCGEIGPP